jgi:hypothetical protein
LEISGNVFTEVGARALRRALSENTTLQKFQCDHLHELQQQVRARELCRKVHASDPDVTAVEWVGGFGVSFSCCVSFTANTSLSISVALVALSRLRFCGEPF